jgi:hypothetical protein
MRRMASGWMATGLALLVLAATPALAQDPAPPGPGDEWQQEDWTSAPPGRRRPMQLGGSMRGPGPVFGPADFQQHMQEMQSRIFGMQNRFQDMQRLAEESKNNALRQSLSISDQQWARIKPRLDRIDELKAEANASIEPGSFGGGSSLVNGGGGFGGGWAGGFATFGGSRSTRGSSGELTQGDRLCEELYNMLQSPGTLPA